MARWQPRFSGQDMDVVENKRVFDGFFKIHQLTFRHRCFEGGAIEITRELFQRGNAVCVLLFDPHKDAIVLIEQFRAGAMAKGDTEPGSPWLLELIAGIVEPGETANDVAERESQEEAGAEISDIVPITRYLPSAGGCDEYVDLLCARVDSSTVSGVHGLAEEGEDILVHTLPYAEVCELVRSGVIDNAATIIAVQWLQLNKQALLQQWGCG